MWNLQNFPKDARVFRVPPCCAFILRDAFQDVYGHRVLINSWPGNGVFPHVAPPTRLHLQFPRETGLILMCAGKIGNPFHTKQEKRHSCCNQEGRRGSNDVVRGTWVLPSSEACIPSINPYPSPDWKSSCLPNILHSIDMGQALSTCCFIKGKKPSEIKEISSGSWITWGVLSLGAPDNFSHLPLRFYNEPYYKQNFVWRGHMNCTAVFVKRILKMFFNLLYWVLRGLLNFSLASIQEGWALPG